MMSRQTHWRGILGRMAAQLIALTTLALALAGPLAVGMAPAARAATTSCGSAKSGCGPPICAPVTAKDYALPTTSPRGGVRARLSRTSGVAGSTDTLTGSGWPASATVELLLGSHQQGSIWVDPTPFAQGVVDASGHLAIKAFQTPQIEQCMTKDELHLGDNQALFVAQTPGARARVSLLFTFFPAPVVESQTPWLVTGGATILVSGEGWEAGQKVTITPAFELWPDSGYGSFDTTAFQKLPAQATTVFAQPNGSFMAGATIPQEPPETLIAFFATASGPRNGDVSVPVNTIFCVIPTAATTLALDHNATLAGGAVSVTGTNWPAGQMILIEYCRGAATLCQDQASEGLAVVRADARGRIAATVHIPDNARPGQITIQAHTATSPFGMSYSFGAPYYYQTRPFAVLYPFAQAHPRLEMALHAAPFAAAALLIALLALGEWLVNQRRRRLAAV